MPLSAGDPAMRQRVLFASSCLFVLSAALVVGAQQPPASAPAPAPAASPAASAAAPRAKAGPSPYTPKVLKGNAAYLAKDDAGAIVAYKEAVAADPTAPLPYYLLAEAQIAAGALPDADLSLKAGLANADKNDLVKCKILFVLADLRERQGKLEEARKAWEEYAQFVTSHPASNGYVATATERIRVIDQHFELAKKSEAVKQRIEQRLKETGGAPGASSAPPASSSAPPPQPGNLK
jgi:tetratricopeptide (TPR) repeat protein